MAAPSLAALRIEGTVNPGSYLYTRRGADSNVDGQVIVACLKFDPSTAPNQSGDGTTYRIESSSLKPYVAVTLSFSGGLISANSRASTASPHATYLYRNYPNGATNEVIFSVTDAQTNVDGTYKGRFHFVWQVSDTDGSGSTLFSDLSGGLSYFQPIELGARQQVAEFNVIELDKKAATTLHLVGTFIATSIVAVKGC